MHFLSLSIACPARRIDFFQEGRMIMYKSCCLRTTYLYLAVVAVLPWIRKRKKKSMLVELTLVVLVHSHLIT